MNANRFDRIAKILAASRSRREVVLGVGGVALAGIAGLGRMGVDVLAQTEVPPSPTVEPFPDFPPIYVEPNWFPFEDVVIAFPAVGTPSAEAAIGAPEEAICGGWDDSQLVEQYDGALGVPIEFVAGHQSPVGNLVWNSNLAKIYEHPGNVNNPVTGEGLRYCSGTLITDNLFLTAAHCFDPTPILSGVNVPRDNNTGSAITRDEIAMNMHVDFNYQEDTQHQLRPVTTVPVVGMVEDGWGGLDGENGVDYAILRLDGSPGQQFGRTRIATQDVPVGSSICIISHPEQDNNHNVKKIAAGPATNFDPPAGPKIIYDNIDTKAGSSGAGILGSPQGPLVGIHTNGGCNSEGYNYGMRIGALLKASPVLREIAAT